ncbi:MAG: type I CRISPR-associated protein Cas7, partial [Acetobacteraceae bacterium]|nr:type I CRISPR-associated protein Cas7 [Acetobacteraceae bacterium]
GRQGGQEQRRRRRRPIPHRDKGVIMTGEVHLDPTRKHDFVFLFDIKDGNPNGDPDAGGMPRTDPETMQGLVTDVAIKRKIRNMVALLGEGKEGYDIYVEAGVSLNSQHERAYTALGITMTKDKNKDVSVQAQVLAMLAEIRQRLGLTMLFITHDLRVAAQVCDRIAVMQRGAIVEQGPTAQVFSSPQHPYTRQLLDSIPGRGWTPPDLSQAA